MLIVISALRTTLNIRFWFMTQIPGMFSILIPRLFCFNIDHITLQSPIELRGPHDVSNLGYLLGLNENQCKAAVGIASCQAIRTAAGRKIGPFRASVVALDDLPAEERWKIPKDDLVPASGSGLEEEDEESDTMDAD
jgi:hypothetical protein